MIDSDIRVAVTSFGYPCVANEYAGTAETYFVFNYSVVPVDFSDDEPQHEKYLVQLHLIAPLTSDLASTRKSIRRAIQAAFMYPTETNVSDEKKQHFVFEFEGVESAG